MKGMYAILHTVSTMFNQFNSTINEAHTFPELHELSAECRARLFSYIIRVYQSFRTYLKFHPNDEYIHATGSLFSTMTSILLDGSSTVKEFLDRDVPGKYEIVGTDIIVEKDGKRSFICPCCGKEISFPADDERFMDEIRDNGGVSLCCPNCSHRRKPLRQAIIDQVFGGSEDEQQ